MIECFTLCLTPIGGAQRGKSVLAIGCSIQRIILSWILVGLHNVTNFVKNFFRSTWMLPAINSWKQQWRCFQKFNLFRLTGGNKFYSFGKHCAQNTRNELRMLPNNGGKEMQSPFGSKGLNFFSFKRIQRTKILPQEWQGNGLGRDCIM